MENLLFSLNTILPLLLLMALGFLCRKIGLLNDSLVKGINQLVFKLFLPVMLWNNVMGTPYDAPISGTAFLLIFFGLLALFGVLFLIVPRLEKDPKKIGVLIQGIGRANYAIFGIPLVSMLFPGQDTSLAALLVVATIPVYNVMSVIALSVYGAGEIRVKRVLMNIAKNPLIIAVALGYALWLLRIQIPPFLKTTVNDLAKLATPLSLFTLGGAIRFASAKAHRRQLALGVLGRLVISPLIFLSIGAALGLRGVAMGCLLIAFGAPTAVSSYPMAQQMGADSELAAEQVAVSSALSILTTFLFIFAMKTLNLI